VVFESDPYGVELQQRRKEDGHYSMAISRIMAGPENGYGILINPIPGRPWAIQESDPFSLPMSAFDLSLKKTCRDTLPDTILKREKARAIEMVRLECPNLDIPTDSDVFIKLPDYMKKCAVELSKGNKQKLPEMSYLVPESELVSRMGDLQMDPEPGPKSADKP